MNSTFSVFFFLSESSSATLFHLTKRKKDGYALWRLCDAAGYEPDAATLRCAGSADSDARGRSGAVPRPAAETLSAPPGEAR